MVIIAFGMHEGDVRATLSHRRCIAGSDGWMMSFDAEPCPHSRNFASAARLSATYVRDEQMFTPEDAVRKLTSLPVYRLGLDDHGRTTLGAVAYVAVLDLDRLTQRATFEAPSRHPEDIASVLVAGRVAVEGGKVTGQRAGWQLARPELEVAQR